MSDPALPAALAARFQAHGVLGEGSFGRVLRATRREDGAEVAIKLLAADADPDRFAREAEAGRRLEHPRLVRTLEVGVAEEGPYLVLPYYPGGTLEDRLESAGPLDAGDAARLLDELLAGLEAAHGAGVIHRDLKPANVLFDADGGAVIADLGLARVLGERTLTQTGWMVGTPRTMPPEQFLGGTPEPSWDLYAAAAIYLEALTGTRPFPGGSPGAVLASKQAGEIQGLGEVSRRAGPGRADLLDAWLGPDVSARPKSVAAARRGLEAADAPVRMAGPEAVATVVPGRAEEGRGPASPTRRGPAVVALLLGALAGFAWWVGRGPEPVSATTRLEISSAGREGLAALADALRGERAIEELLTSTELRRTPAFTRRRGAALRATDEVLTRHLSAALLAELEGSRLDLALTRTLGQILLRLRLVRRERDDQAVRLREDDRLSRLEAVYARVVRIVRVPALSDYPRGDPLDWEARTAAERQFLDALGGRWECRRARADWPEYDLPSGTIRSARILKTNLAGVGFLPQGGEGTTRLITDMFRGGGDADYRRKVELDEPLARIGPLRQPPGADLLLAGRTMGWDQTIQGVLELVGEEGLEVVFAVPYQYFPPPEFAPGERLHTARTGWVLWVRSDVLPRETRMANLRVLGLQALGPPQRTASLDQAWHQEQGPTPALPELRP